MLRVVARELAEHGEQIAEGAAHLGHSFHPGVDPEGNPTVMHQPVSLKSIPAAVGEMTQQAKEYTAAQQAQAAAFAEQATAQAQQARAEEVEAKHTVDLGIAKVEDGTALRGASMAMQFAGPGGMAASTLVDAAAGSAESARELDTLIDSYRNIVAKTLNIIPEKVDESALRRAADIRAEQHNDSTLKEALEHIDSSTGRAFGESAVSLGGFATGMAVGGIPGAIVGGIAASQITPSEETLASQMIQEAVQKFASEKQLLPSDVFAVRVYQLGSLKELVKEKASQMGLSSERFEELGESEKLHLMHAFDDVYQEATRDASLINAGLVTPDLLMEKDLSKLIPANRNKPIVGPHTEQVAAEREAALLAQHEII